MSENSYIIKTTINNENPSLDEEQNIEQDNNSNEDIINKDHNQILKHNIKSNEIHNKYQYSNTNESASKLPHPPKEKRPNMTLQDSYIKYFLQLELQSKNQVINYINSNPQYISNLNYKSLTNTIPKKDIEEEKTIRKTELIQLINKLDDESKIGIPIPETQVNKKDFTQRKRYEKRFEFDPLDPFPKNKPMKTSETSHVSILNNKLANKILNVQEINHNIDSNMVVDFQSETNHHPIHENSQLSTIQKPAEVYGIKNNSLMTENERDKLIPHSIRKKKQTDFNSRHTISNNNLILNPQNYVNSNNTITLEKPNLISQNPIVNNSNIYDEQEEFNRFLKEIYKK